MYIFFIAVLHTIYKGSTNQSKVDITDRVDMMDTVATVGTGENREIL